MGTAGAPMTNITANTIPGPENASSGRAGAEIIWGPGGAQILRLIQFRDLVAPKYYT